MFHRLRILNFSKSAISDETNKSKTILKPMKPIHEQNDEIPERNSSITIHISTVQEPKCSKEISKQECALNNDDKEDGSDLEASCPMFQPNLSIPKKSLSETCTHKKNSIKHLCQRKTTSLTEITRRKVDQPTNRCQVPKRHQYYKTFKLAIQDKFLQTLKKDITTKTSRRNLKRLPENMKVAFMCCSKEHTLQSTSARNVYNKNKLLFRRRRKKFDVSTSYSDIFGFIKKKKLDPYFLYQRTKNDENVFQKMDRRCDKKIKNLTELSRRSSLFKYKQPMKVVSSGLGCDSSTSNDSLRYNVVGFPLTTSNKGPTDETERLTTSTVHLATIESNLISSRCCIKERPRERKNASINCTKLKSKTSCKEAGCTTSKNIVFRKLSPKTIVSCTKKPPQKHSIPKCRKCIKKTVSFKRRRPKSNDVSFIKSSVFRKCQVFSEKIYHKRAIQGKTVVKYIILAIVAVAWAPCVLAIACGWFLTYPLRPQQIINDDDKKRCQEECAFNNNDNNSFWAFMVGNMKNAFHKTMSTGSAIKSLLVPNTDNKKTKSQQFNSSPTLINSGPTELPKHPDPQRRYTLCYNEERGWVMKPVRQRKRNRVGFSVFNQVMQKFVCGRVSTSKNRGNDMFVYNVQTEKKTDCKCPDAFDKGVMTSSIHKLPVRARSKHFELVDKRQSKTKSFTNACKRYCHPVYKTYTDKDTGGKTKYRFSPQITTCMETSTNTVCNTRSLTARTNNQRKPSPPKAYLKQRTRSSVIEKELYQTFSSPNIKRSFCRKCCKPHARRSPQNLRNVSGSRVYQEQTGHRNTNSAKSRGRRRRRPRYSSATFMLEPKRGQSEISVNRPKQEFMAHPVEKRSRSESSKGGSCECPDKSYKDKPYAEFSDHDIYKEGALEQKAPVRKKESLKKYPIRKPSKERFDIKVKRKKIKRRKLKKGDDKKKKKKIPRIAKPVILIEKIVPTSRKKKAGFRDNVLKYGTCPWLVRLDKTLHDKIWPMNLNCQNLYLYTMKTRPCFWVYGVCPSFYPKFLSLYNCFMGCVQSCMICLSVILWSPCLLCFYACYLCCCDMFCNN